MTSTGDILSHLMYGTVGVAVIAFVLLLAIGRVFRAVYARRAAKAAGPPPGVCRCGYPLGQLAVPRCPECGRVVGFDATPEELGLTDEQLRRVQQARRDRSTSW